VPPNAPDERARGVAYAVSTYLAWGLLPVYFKALRPVPAVEVLAHRVVWSLVLLAAIVAALSGARALAAPFRRLPVLAVSTALIATNWLVYIWAVQSGRVLEASLGYFVNPLVNVLLGVAFLGETLSRRQRVAVAIAASPSPRPSGCTASCASAPPSSRSAASSPRPRSSVRRRSCSSRGARRTARAPSARRPG